MTTQHAVRFASSLVVILVSSGSATADAPPDLNSNVNATYTLYLDFSGFSYNGKWGPAPGALPPA
jgi:hypothetical protein